MGIVLISHSINLLSLQVVRDYVNRRAYFNAKAQVTSQHHVSINLDFNNPVSLESTLESNEWQNVYQLWFSGAI